MPENAVKVSVSMRRARITDFLLLINKISTIYREEGRGASHSTCHDGVK